MFWTWMLSACIHVDTETEAAFYLNFGSWWTLQVKLTFRVHARSRQAQQSLEMYKDEHEKCVKASNR